MKAIINKDYNDQLKSVDIIADDNNISFTIVIKSNTEIEVRSTDYVKVDNKIYDMRLEIIPNVSNSITIRKPSYD